MRNTISCLEKYVANTGSYNKSTQQRVVNICLFQNNIGDLPVSQLMVFSRLDFAPLLKYKMTFSEQHWHNDVTCWVFDCEVPYNGERCCYLCKLMKTEYLLHEREVRKLKKLKKGNQANQNCIHNQKNLIQEQAGKTYIGGRSFFLM